MPEPAAARPSPAQAVFCIAMFIFDGVNLSISSWGAYGWVPSLCVNRWPPLPPNAPPHRLAAWSSGVAARRRWAVESMYTAVVENYAHRYTLDSSLERLQYHFGGELRCNACIIALGVCWRAVAFCFLLRSRGRRRR